MTKLFAILRKRLNKKLILRKENCEETVGFLILINCFKTEKESCYTVGVGEQPASRNIAE